MYTKDNSWNSFATHMIEEGYAKDENTLLEHLALIPAKSREIIEKRWGLIEKVYYSDFEQLNEQMGIDNARELYFEAMRDLFNAEYAAIGMKRYNMQTISHWNEVVAWGMLFAQDTTTTTATENLGKEEETSVVKKDNSELLKRPLEEFNILTGNLSRTLALVGCKTLGDLLKLDSQILIRHNGFGSGQAIELTNFLELIEVSENVGKELYNSLGKYFRFQPEFLHKRNDLSYIAQSSTSELLKIPLHRFYTFPISQWILKKVKCETLEELLNCDAIQLRKGVPSDRRNSAKLFYFLSSIGSEKIKNSKLYNSLIELYDWNFLLTIKTI